MWEWQCHLCGLLSIAKGSVVAVGLCERECTAQGEQQGDVKVFHCQEIYDCTEAKVG